MIEASSTHSRGRIALWVIGGLALLMALLLFSWRPSPVLGVNGGALQQSVGGFLSPSDSCDERWDGAWSCGRNDDQMSGSVEYRVEVDGLGCWNAIRVGSPGEGSRKNLSGCLTLFDFVFG